MRDVSSAIDQFATVAYSYRATVQHTYDMALKVLNEALPGVMVECGVGAGAQIAAMLLADMNAGPVRSPKLTIWAFDSFEGIPLAGPNDDQQPGIGAIVTDVNAPLRDRLKSSGVTVHSVDNVEQNLRRFGLPVERVNFIKGWFQDRLTEFRYSFPEICLLRLDGDLYESTEVCMMYLYPHVVPGGVVIIDDYALPGCRKAFEDYFRQLGTDPPATTPVEGGGGPVWFIKD